MSFFRHLVLFVLLLLIIPQKVFAIVDPSAVSNNKFGIHIAVANEEDLNDAATLVNTNGGDWGYVTVIIQQNDRDNGKWQEIFNRMRKLHLIPIVRIATEPQGAVWKRPVAQDAAEWARFLNSLNWVVQNRYVILFNEPNHAQEWGGAVLSEDYAHVAFTFAQELKNTNRDFYVMLAGLDEAAPSQGPQYEDAGIFLSRVLATKSPNDWSVIDGISSHAYPNPGFVGSPEGWGKGSVRGYQWLQEAYSQAGISRQLPVFITETGWDQSRVGEQNASNYLIQAYQNIWLKDKNVIAVTPFVLNYQSDPFLGFSWKKQGESSFYSLYTSVQNLEKEKGDPQQKNKLEIISSLPNTFTAGSTISFALRVKNKGESIIDAFDGYLLAIEPVHTGFEYVFSPVVNLEPGEETNISVFIRTPKKTGISTSRIVLKKNNKVISTVSSWKEKVIPKINMAVFVKLMLGFTREVGGYEVQLFDQREHLVYKGTDMHASAGKIALNDIPNVIVGERYRAVVLRPYYLPRQAFTVMKESGNSVKLKRMLPLDWNRDGKWSLSDLWWFTK